MESRLIDYLFIFRLLYFVSVNTLPTKEIYNPLMNDLQTFIL